MPEFETEHVTEAVEPFMYSYYRGYPFLNIAMWWNVPYSYVLGIASGTIIPEKAVSETMLRHIAYAEEVENKRRKNYFGSMPYGVV